MTTNTNASLGQERGWADTPPLSPAIRHVLGEAVESQGGWLDKLAAPIQNWLLKLFGQPGEPNRKVKTALNGAWLGHPLHPLLTDIPIGAWSGTLLFDLVSLNDESETITRGADIMLGLGLMGAVGAAVTGTTDWSDLDGSDRRVGLVHGLLNTAITAANLVSLILRLTGKRRAGIALSTAGYAVTAISAYLGGDLVFAKGIGVNHVSFEGGSDDFVSVMNAQDLVEGKLTKVDVAGIPAVLLREGRSIYAIGNTCSHLGGPLDEGTLHDGTVQCPWHGSCFRMSDGSVVDGPATYAQPTFAVRVREGNIELRRLESA